MLREKIEIRVVRVEAVKSTRFVFFYVSTYRYYHLCYDFQLLTVFEQYDIRGSKRPHFYVFELGDCLIKLPLTNPCIHQFIMHSIRRPRNY